MTTESQAAVAPLRLGSGVHWPSIVAGAIVASALAFVLHSFAVALGLGVSSLAPTWRDASFALMLLSGLYMLLVAVASYAFGGYVTSRLRLDVAAEGAGDTEFRDGMHGLLAWALATLLTFLLVFAAVQVASRLAVPPSSNNAGPSSSVAGENLIALDLDRLFRSDRRPASDMTYTRAEAARILLTTSSHNGLHPEDRAYLVRLVQSNTALTQQDAERRVQDVITRANEDLTRARKSGVLIGFMIGVSALLGAAAAWFAACTGGRYRDGRERAPAWFDWNTTRRGRPSGR
jgi:hypothetical protein